MKSMNVYLLALSTLVSCSVFAMQQRSAVSVEFSNQTQSYITIIKLDGKVVTLPSLQATSISIQPDMAMVTGEEKVTTVVTQNGAYSLDYNGLLNMIYIKKDGNVILRLAKPRNPIIIFEANNAMPTLKERV